jgi:hypothetical protein
LDTDASAGAGNLDGEKQADPIARERFVVHSVALLEDFAG